jgi:acyl carrier protein
MKKTENLIITKIAKILSVKKKDLVKKNDFTKFKEWDSLKHLEIITELDKILGKKIKKVKNPSQITNLKKLLSILKK